MLIGFWQRPFLLGLEKTILFETRKDVYATTTFFTADLARASSWLYLLVTMIRPKRTRARRVAGEPSRRIGPSRAAIVGQPRETLDAQKRERN